MTNNSSKWLKQRNTVWESMQKACKPKPKMNGTDWVNNNFYLSAESSSQAGKMTLHPYQEEIINCMCDETTNQVSIMKSARVGYNKMINATIAYFIVQKPASILFASPSDDEAFGLSESEIIPMIRDNPQVANRVYAKNSLGKAKKDRTTKKTYAGGILELVGAFSPKNFRRRTVKVAIGDEVDGWDSGVNDEGDRVELLRKRTSDFWDRKLILGSTPTLKKHSKISDAYLAGDQRKRHLPCPHCNKYQPLEFTNLSWKLDDEHYLIEDSVGFTCQNEKCGELITQEHHREMDKLGKWIATKPFRGHASFFVWAAYSYSFNANWVQIVRDWMEAEKNHTKLQPFINTVLGEVYEEKFDNITVDTLIDKKEDYEYEVPSGVVVLTMGIDTQPNRLEYTVAGWGANKEGWVITKGVFMGDPNGLEVWDELDNFIANSEYESVDGMMKIYVTTIDRGGHNTEAVDSFCKTRASRNIFPIIGATSLTAPIITHKIPPQKAKVKYTTPFYLLGVKVIKDTIYSGIVMNHGGGANYIHFPDNESFDDAYFNQLLAEKRDAKGRWVKKNNSARNEAFDTLGYSYAGLRILNSKGINVDKLAAQNKRLLSTTNLKRKIVRGALSKGVDVWG